MYFAKEEIFTKDDIEYIILSVIKENDIEYAFANRLDNETEDITEEYYIFMYTNNNVYILTDEKIIGQMLPKFQEQIKINLQELGIEE